MIFKHVPCIFSWTCKSTDNKAYTIPIHFDILPRELVLCTPLCGAGQCLLCSIRLSAANVQVQLQTPGLKTLPTGKPGGYPPMTVHLTNDLFIIQECIKLNIHFRNLLIGIHLSSGGMQRSNLYERFEANRNYITRLLQPAWSFLTMNYLYITALPTTIYRAS